MNNIPSYAGFVIPNPAAEWRNSWEAVEAKKLKKGHFENVRYIFNIIQNRY